MKKQLLPRDMAWIDADGKPTDLFFDLIASLHKNTPTKPVSVTEPTNGQVLIYSSTTDQYEPGAN
jgi:hypothetical protein